MHTILPHLDYCSTIWGNCNSDFLEKLHKFERRAAGVILDKDYLAHTEELFTQLGWVKFSDRVNYKKIHINVHSTQKSNTQLYTKQISTHTC